MRTSRSITVVGCHAEGEIGDVITGGVLPPTGATMFARMQTMQREHDDIRRFLLCEPRGHVGRHVNLLTPPIDPGCDAGVIIMEPTEYPPMSGSNLMCSVTVLLETGMVAMREPETVVMMDTPAGPVRARATCRDGKCVSVEIENVPSMVLLLDAVLEVAGHGSIMADIAYGGMIYALVDATRLGFSIVPDEARELAVLGERVRLAAREQLRVAQPENPDIAGVSIVQLNAPFAGAGQVSRNTCIVAPGRSDRSPTGTGTCARMAVLHARGQLRVGEGMIHESIIGSRFEGRILGETEIAGRPAILPAIRGRAWITGQHQYFLDPSDPYPAGYLVADTWGVTGAVTQD
ncbi:MAG: proline racemase family protein [Rhodospirillales bacterium]|nr:proline racemase family protein [Rhodospirillales bacterium]MDE2574256.1 proline racemase family protein [Rhodospirillales bacterium]